ncbi:MAG: methyl-accepting chemotaxis protein [Gammaproteobacteria bacterium]|nr:methyl-accepting chemotaxis protein [Gammaproteobacteria bacterium]
MSSLAAAVQEVTRVTEAMNDGDLGHHVQGRYEGQLGLIAGALNDTNNSLSQMVQNVLSMAGGVNQTAQEIHRGGQHLSSRAHDQAASLEQTAASMEEMAGSVRLNSENAQRADDMMRRARADTQVSTEIVTQAMTAMEGVNQASAKIAEIITIIDGIAFQTNLLALNASVEAARAGEQGRGFAVVAGEVRTLAQRSADAAKDISALITDTRQRVSTSNRLVQETGESLQAINHDIEQVATSVAAIADASKEQALGIEQVNHAVNQLEGINQQNADLVEKSAASATGLIQQSAALNDAMQGINTVAQKLEAIEHRDMPEHTDIKNLVADLGH